MSNALGRMLSLLPMIALALPLGNLCKSQLQ
jgi:hypothetical protein